MPESYVEALYAYQAAEKNQISLHPHEKIQVLERDDSGWWIGRNSKGDVGIFPSTYVQELKATKVFNKPKEMKPLPVQSASVTTSGKTLSRAEQLANDLGLDTEETDDTDDNEQELQAALNEISELKNKCIQYQTDRDLAIQRMREVDEEANECRKQADTARTQLNILKKTNITIHENARRLQQEVADLKDELAGEGRTVPEYKYECTPDEAIERFLTGALGSTKQENEQLTKDLAECRQLIEKLETNLANAEKKGSKHKPEGEGNDEDAEANGTFSGEGVDPKEHERVRNKYKKLEAEYKKLRKENKELKAQLEEGGDGEKAARVSSVSGEEVEELRQRVAQLQDELAQRPTVAAEDGEAANSSKSEISDLKSKLKKLDAKRKEEKEERARLTDELQKAIAEREKAVAERDSLASARSNETQEVEALRAENKKLNVKIDKALAEKDAQYEELAKKYKKEEKRRRQLFNQLQELKGNIRVYCRCKPPSPEDGPLAVTVTSDGVVEIVDEASGKQHSFEFDASYGAVARQEDIFADVQPLATSVLDGFNVCIFAYGQTGSGKTYTMEGPPDNPGVNYRAVAELFRVVAERADEYATTVRISVIEVYNEVVHDLLNKRNKLEVHISAAGVSIPDMQAVVVTDTQQVIDHMQRGYECRKTASTNMNEHSSRSHCLLSIYVETKNKATDVTTLGKLHLVDLAGSERQAKTGIQTKERMLEANNINTSLTHLAKVINDLVNKRPHIPYRNSALTKLLQDSLGGNCKCLMFANISMVQSNVSETISTLKLASQARMVEVGKTKANKVEANA